MPKENGAAGTSGTMESLTGWVAAVGKSPPVAFVAVGLLVVLAGTVTRIGPLEFASRGSVTVLLGVGGVLMAVGIVWYVLARRELISHDAIVTRGDDGEPLAGLPSVTYDARFLLDLLYYAMPPAFVKELHLNPDDPSKIQSSHHIIRNAAFLNIQRDSELLPAKVRTPARKDYNEADERALEEGRSWQLEVADRLAGDRKPVTILTTKTMMRREGKVYIVGWYIPIELESKLELAGDDVCLNSYAHQPIFHPVLSGDDEGLAVHVAPTLRRTHNAIAEPESD